MKQIKSLLLALSIVGMTLTGGVASACPNCPHHKSGKCDCAKKADKCDCAKKKDGKCDCPKCACAKKGGKCECDKKVTPGPKKK
jgi:hypothetical protein